MLRQRVTIRDIAKQTGMHFTTVSMALRNSPRLKAATRVKIQKLAKKLGYVPDPMLAALNAYRQTRTEPQYQATIAWINNWPDKNHLLSIPVFREYYDSAAERARERGYILEEFWLQAPGMTARAISQIFRARNIQGVLIAPQPVAQQLLPLAYDEFSAVALGYSMRPAALHVVTNHQFHTMKLIMERLDELGYRRMALAVDDWWDGKVEHAWSGGAALWNLENQNRITVLRCSEYLRGDELKTWLRKEEPDVVVATGNFVPAFRELKYRFPEDIGFLCMALNRGDVDFSGVYQNDSTIGRQAIDLIIDMIHRGERGIPTVPMRTLVESAWNPGKTLRQQKSPAARGVKAASR